jgi:hypothetical protein
VTSFDILALNGENMRRVAACSRDGRMGCICGQRRPLAPERMLHDYSEIAAKNAKLLQALGNKGTASDRS